MNGESAGIGQAYVREV